MLGASRSSCGGKTTLRDRLVKIGAKIVRHGRSITFQMAEVAVPRALFQDILAAIAALRSLPPALWVNDPASIRRLAPRCRLVRPLYRPHGVPPTSGRPWTGSSALRPLLDATIGA